MEKLDTVCVAATAYSGEVEKSSQTSQEKCQILWSKLSDNLVGNRKGYVTSTGSYLRSFNDIFAGPDDSLGHTLLLKHSIDTGNASPIRQSVQQLCPSKCQEVNQLIETMLKKDVIQPSCSPWAYPIVLVKKDRSTRFCLDYHKLTILL